MSAAVRRRLRLPVVSRLTLAWTTFVFVLSLFVGLALWRGDVAVKLAMPKAPETIARPVVAATPVPATTGAAVALREDAEVHPAIEDVYAELGPEPLEQPLADAESVVITIDGAPAPDARLPVRPGLAAAVAPVVSIPGPDPALQTRTPFGFRPAVAADGRRASSVYARPYAAGGGEPRVALIVGGLSR